MSRISERIGNRYDDILAYFKRVPFGVNPPDMSALSWLPPIDRCLILERVLLDADGDMLALVDKLSMAYLKAGWLDLAIYFVRAACRRGLIDVRALGYFEDKLTGMAGVRMSSSSYEESMSNIRQDISGQRMAPEMCDLLLDLCEGYQGRDIFSGVDFGSPIDAPDIKAFMDERCAFIRLIAGV